MLEGKTLRHMKLRRIGLVSFLVFSGGGVCAIAQVTGALPVAPSGVPESSQLLSPEQLENLVAPVALYPDQLLSQVLAAFTYPPEIVEAQRWLQQRGNLQGVQLMDTAKQQNWDPSVQALVAFPDALALLSRDIQWTTALGNAFLAQQADVMNAIQGMRARAQSNGRLRSTPQQIVSIERQDGQGQDGQNAVEIQPANPQVMYVPSYNPQSIWGPPVEGYYPELGYPSYSQNSYGQDVLGEIFGAAVNLASYFTGFGSLLGGGWGWALNWFTHSLLLNGLFFNSFGFHGGGGYGGGVYGGGYGARSAWVHDPGHRMGVPYSNAAVAGRFGGNFRPTSYGSRAGFASAGFGSSRGWNSSGGWRTMAGGQRGFGAGAAGQGAVAHGFSSSFSGAGNGAGGWHSPAGGSFGAAGNRGFSSSGSSGGYRSSAANGMSSGYRSSSSSGWGLSARSSLASPDRSYSRNAFSGSASAQRFSEPRVSSQHFSAPKAPHFSAPKSSRSGGGHSSGGHGGGGHSHGGSHKH